MKNQEVVRAIAARCESRVNEITRRITGTGFDRIPGLRDVPAEMKDVEIAASVRYGLRLFLRQARQDSSERGSDWARHFRERTAQHAEEGVSLEALLDAHLLCQRELWVALRDCTEPGQEPALLDMADQLLAGQARLLRLVAETYLREQAYLAAETEREQHRLLSGLLAGTLTAGQLGGLELENGALVLAVHLPAPSSAVAGRRRLRRMNAVLDRELGRPVLVHFRTPLDPNGHVIVPREPTVTQHCAVGLSGLVAETLGEPVHFALAQGADPVGIAAASRTADEVLRLVLALRRPPGCYGLEDVLLEYQLSRPGEGGRGLTRLLDPVAAHPDLLLTLRVYLDAGQNRRAVADRLSLHPNTVDNRIGRVRALTGVDAASPRGFALLLAALAARELRVVPPPKPGLGESG
ncbi:PucR family transcriptional regulator [Streptomyces sp. bgisy031]|uniref:PucR family transcriptional regulator n=1 Tax=Streptomyces sp. bgisy031 TaxID=3413772 RepID=UPI003D740A41